jgi:hypothetical protein
MRTPLLRTILLIGLCSFFLSSMRMHAVNASDKTYEFRFAEETASVQISVQDEFTFYAAGAPLVAGAHVVISDDVTSVVYADGFSNAAGVFVASGIPAGVHLVTVSDSVHYTSSQILAFTSGVVNTLSIFISLAPDLDGDGYYAQYDCNDADPTIHPGVLEVCGDGIDNDCDGVDGTQYYADVDGDGYGDPAAGGVACSVPNGYVTNNSDLCPNDPLKFLPGACTCGIPDTDTDQDGTADCNDWCPNDSNKTLPGICGCGVSDADTDGDGAADCNDGCPNDPLKTAAGICGCGTADTDSDNDGTADCNDACPNDHQKIIAGICGCGVADTDTDGDGTADCADNCPNVPGQVGSPCDDGDPCTVNDALNGSCTCAGILADADGDGVCDASDCAPGNASVYPGAVELCDGIDNDCDGVIDERTALDFDGADDHVLVGSWFPEQVFTIEMWLKPGSTQNMFANIVDNNHATNVRWVCQQDGNTTNQYYWAVAAGPNALVYFSLQPDTWQHLALIKSPAQVAVYVNGTLVGTAPASGAINGVGSGDFIRLGKWAGGGREWNGSMDDVRFWNTARTEAEIQATMFQAVPPQAGLVANYPLNDGVPNANNAGVTSLADASGNGNTATPLGFAMTGNGSNFISDIADQDGDGLSDCIDNCPTTPGQVGSACNDNNACTTNDVVDGDCQCTGTLLDADGDGSCDLEDCAPNDAAVYPGSPELCDGLDNDCDGLVDVLSALDFDGVNDHIVLPPALSNGPWSALTVEAWVRSNGSTGDFQAILSAADFTFVHLQTNIGGNSAVYTDQGGVLLPVVPAHPPGEWHHVALSVASGNSVLYVDGAPLGTSSMTFNTVLAPGTLTIGQGFQGGRNFFGQIRDLRIWNVARTVVEVQADMNSVPQPTPALVLRMPLNDGTPGANNASITTVSDLSGNAHNGTLVNFALSGSASNWIGISPAVEVCDGVDNDCDGQVDEGAGATWYYDNDADGFGMAGTTLRACEQPNGYAPVPGDCDDSDASINPMAYDACPDGIDNNCNGLIDEQSSLIGQVCSSSVGLCQPGVWNCVNNMLTCVGGILPGPEICSDGLDNDCDGLVDEASPETVPLTWYLDADGDGFGDPNPALILLSCDQQPGYALNGDDCDDAAATTHPGAIETCNAVDDDCDGLVDEGTLLTWFFDEDGDGFGNDAVTLTSCTQPNGYVAVGADCDDLTPTTYPGAPEVCNGVDDDCDGDVDGDDANAVLAVWYLDNDGDGYGITGITTAACDPPLGYASQPGDCNDNNAAVHPNAPDVCIDGVDNNCNGGIDEGSSLLGQPCSGAPCSPASWGCVGGVLTCVPGTGPAVEICGDGIDNDCDGQIDEEDFSSVPQTYYVDADGDGYGDPSQTTQSCFPVQGLVTIGGDCNDASAAINPGALEVCDGIDNNCDGAIDLGTGTTWYLDADGDGFAGGAISILACTQPAGYTFMLGDCDDADPSINPAAFDACPDGIDNNCNGQVDEQSAMIGQPCGADIGLCVLGTWTCVGNVLTCVGGVPPTAEICSDGIDNDCDGQVDEDSPETVPLTWYLDGDGDGFGDPDPLLTVLSCDPQPGYSVSAGDCDDSDAAINPVVTEVCNGIDDNCDGQVDEGCGSCSPADIALLLANTAPSQACVLSCYGGPFNQLQPCLTNCYVDAGFSPACASCVVEFQFCAAINCPECQTDPNSPACIACRQTAGCDAAFAACSGLQDADGDGEFAPMDCDDSNATVNPNGVEGCTVDGLDNDCDGQVDEDAVVDADNDGFTLCTGDCNDMNPDIHPGATEVCNGVDDDCDGIVDNGFPTYYLDNDGDGFGDPNVLGACGASGSVPNNLDCDDADPTVYNGAPELCDGLDNDCDGTVDDNLSEDLDGDGFTPCLGDCDDGDATIFPGAPELCDGLDNDCNGAIEPTLFADADGDGYGASGITVPCGQPGVLNDDDCADGDPLITLPPTWYPDADGDGYGVFGVQVVACTQPPGHAGNSFDCNDADPLVFPGQGCTECSPADLALMASDPSVINASQACSVGCGGASDLQECLSDCLSANGLSEPCADCFAAYGYCLTASCPICLEQPESPACLACLANSGCKEDFMACSGLADDDNDGYFAPFDCNDQDTSVNPDAMEICDGIDNDCDGVVDEGPDSDGDGINDCADGCVFLFGDIGDPCQLSSDPMVPTGIINETCTCTVACSESILIDLRTDQNSQQASYIIREEGSGQVRCEGSGFFPGITTPIVSECCLPQGCFKLEVFDSGGDGFVSGGYQVREAGPDGRRIIDNFSNFQTGSYSSVAEPTSFCLPVGTDGTIFSSCDKLDWVNNKFIVARANPVVSAQFGVTNAISGYEFWFFDPNGSYSYRRFRSHATSDGFGTGATRACHFKLNGWVNSPITPHLPANLLLNVRIRGRVAGENLPFGPACQFKIDHERAACPLARLQDDPSNPEDFSCGVIRQWGGPNSAGNRIVANPPQPVPSVPSNMVRYQFRFRIPGEGVCLVRPPQTSARIHLNWNSGSPLDCSKTYEVDVRVSLDGGTTWCFGPTTAAQSAACASDGPWGRICNVTIQPCGTQNSSAMTIGGDDQSDMVIFPNPNNGRSMRFSFVGPVNTTNATIEFMAMNGSIVFQRAVRLEDGASSFSLDLDGDLSNGIYLARVQMGERTHVQRVVVQE